jgi:glutathione S-transferase
MPPRIDLMDRLGIRYRRIPVLAIGRDVYVDSSLIADALEKRFPESAGYATMFPPRKGSQSRDTGLVKAFLTAYVDRSLFTTVTRLLPWDRMPEAFVKDRSAVRYRRRTQIGRTDHHTVPGSKYQPGTDEGPAADQY